MNTLTSFPQWRITLAAIMAIFIAAIAVFWNASINYDASWLLHMSAQMRGGATAYVDIVEVNPPLIAWLNMPAIWISEVLPITIGAGFKLYVLTLAALSVAFCARLLRPLPMASKSVLLIAIAYVLTLMTAPQFGQREHFMLILCLPYFCVTASRMRGVVVPTSLAVLAALAAGLGFCIKPFFVLVPAAVELFVLASIGLKSTLRRPEPYVMMVVGLAYLAAVLIFTPEYLQLMTGYTGKVYGSNFNADVPKILLQTIAITGGAAVAGLAFRKSGRTWKQADPLYVIMSVAALVMLATYFIQFKGFPNHLYPTRALMLVMICGGVFHILKEKRISILYAGVLAAVVAGSITRPLSAVPKLDEDFPLFEAALETYPQSDSLFVMSAYLYDGFPMVTEYNLRWGSRFPSLWIAPGLETERAKATGARKAELDEIRTLNHIALAEDFARYKPSLVYVDERADKHDFAALDYDYIADYTQTPEFAREWTHYERTEFEGAYTLYVRKPVLEASLSGQK